MKITAENRTVEITYPDRVSFYSICRNLYFPNVQVSNRKFKIECNEAEHESLISPVTNEFNEQVKALEVSLNSFKELNIGEIKLQRPYVLSPFTEVYLPDIGLLRIEVITEKK